jgi:hypothetical protein
MYRSLCFFTAWAAIICGLSGAFALVLIACYWLICGLSLWLASLILP